MLTRFNLAQHITMPVVHLYMSVQNMSFVLHSVVFSAVILFQRFSENVNFSKFAAPHTPYWW